MIGPAICVCGTASDWRCQSCDGATCLEHGHFFKFGGVICKRCSPARPVCFECSGESVARCRCGRAICERHHLVENHQAGDLVRGMGYVASTAVCVECLREREDKKQARLAEPARVAALPAIDSNVLSRFLVRRDDGDPGDSWDEHRLEGVSGGVLAEAIRNSNVAPQSIELRFEGEACGPMLRRRKKGQRRGHVVLLDDHGGWEFDGDRKNFSALFVQEIDDVWDGIYTHGGFVYFTAQHDGHETPVSAGALRHALRSTSRVHPQSGRALGAQAASHRRILEHRRPDL